MSHDVDWAFDQYESVRAALPSARFPAQSQRFDHLRDALAPFETILLDAFGVLNVGETAIPGAADLIAALRAEGKRVAIVSNSASVPTPVSLAKFHRLGFDFTEAEIVTSRDTLKTALAAQPPRRWGVMATQASQIDELDVDCVPLQDDPAAYQTADAFILLGSAEWTPAQQDRLAAALTERARPVFVGNPDIVAPRETGLSLEPGYYAHDLAKRTECAPEFFGKPFSNIFKTAAAHCGPFNPATTVMIGDTLHTDVLGGAAAGINTVLLESYGLFAGRDVTTYIRRSGLVPDIVAQGH